MARGKSEFECEGISLEITQLGALDQSVVLFRLGKLLGPAFGNFDDVEKLARILQGCAQQEDFVYIRDAFIRSAKSRLKLQDAAGSVITQPLADTVDDLFSGRMVPFFTFIAHCVKVNFADFLGAIATAMREALASEAAKASKHPTE